MTPVSSPPRFNQHLAISKKTSEVHNWRVGSLEGTGESNFSDPLEKDGVGGAEPMERPKQESPTSSQRNLG